jgi:plastocyanin
MKKLIGSKMRLLTGTAFLMAILSILYSCSKSTAYNTPSPGPGTKGGPGTNEVWISGMAFNPTTITVKAGTTIKWTNKEGVSHTVTSDPESSEVFDSGSLGDGGIFTWTFSTAGTFSYHCSFHSNMKAKVVVN